MASPLLANVVLNKLDWFLHSKGSTATAGDSEAPPRPAQCPVLPAMPMTGACSSRAVNRQYAERLKDEIRDFLRETCGLELSAEKTRITHVRDGYDFLGFNISVGVGKSGTVVPKVKVGRKAITNIQTSVGRSPSLSPNAGKHLGPPCSCFGSHSWLVELLQGCPQLLTSCARAGPQGFLDRGESDMQEGRHIDCQMSPQVPSSGTPLAFTRTVPWPASKIRRRRTTTRRRSRINPAVTSRTWKTTNGRPLLSSQIVDGPVAETSSGRLWSATAFIAVGARSWSHPRPRTRTISNLSTALPTSQWRTTWTTSRRLCLRCHKLKTARDK